MNTKYHILQNVRGMVTMPQNEEFSGLCQSALDQVRSTISSFESNSSARSAVNTQIARLEEQIESIHSALAAIRTISMQVKILSINASIEAAHAGAAGKGFAVVATEIGSLSTQTDTASQNIGNTVAKISEIIADARSDMQYAMEIGKDFKGALDHCGEMIAQIAEQV